MDKMSCSFTAHRQSRLSFSYSKEDEKCIRLKQILTGEIEKLIQSGVTVFYTGMTSGVDIWAAQIVLDMRREHPGVKLIAVLAYETQADKWPAEQRKIYFDILAECSEVVTLNTHYSRSCINERNHWLVDHAEYLTVVYDGFARWGTAYTFKYAVQKRRRIIMINADTLEVSAVAEDAALK